MIGNAAAYLAEVTIEKTKVIAFADYVFCLCEKCSTSEVMLVAATKPSNIKE